MCKPVLTNQPLAWSPGFHSSDHALRFDELYLFHLHWADLSIGLDRLHKTRDMPWSSGGFGSHQRVTDAAWLELFDGMAGLPQTRDFEFAPTLPPLREWLEKTAQSGEGRANETFRIDLGINGAELWPIPPHFRARL